MIRVVHLNPIEPAAMSMRSPRGFDLLLDLIYRNANASPVTADLAATLVLQGRSANGTAVTYPVAATDVVNGKARTRVPGGDLTDPNGYQTTLVGTVDGIRQIIGFGVLDLTGDGATEVTTADIIDTVPLTLVYGQDANVNITLWHDTSGSIPFDMTDEDTAISATVFDVQGGAPLAAFTVTVLAVNKVGLSLPLAVVNTLPAACWWALYAATSLGTTTLAEGPVSIGGP